MDPLRPLPQPPGMATSRTNDEGFGGYWPTVAADVHLRLLEAIPAPGVTHLHCEVAR